MRKRTIKLLLLVVILLMILAHYVNIQHTLPIRTPDVYSSTDDPSLGVSRNPSEVSRKWSERNLSKTMKTLGGVLFDYIPPSFEKKFRNPCWYNSEGNLQCLPYFYLAGMGKSGSSDVWHKAVDYHPNIVSKGVVKEVHFWTWSRFEPSIEKAFGKYLARQRPLVKLLRRNREQDRTAIIGDGSPSTLWNIGTTLAKLFPGVAEVPAETRAHLIHTFQPDARIMSVFRNPTDRSYSDYHFFSPSNTRISPGMFHTCSMAGIEQFNLCLQKHTMRTCAYTMVGKVGNELHLNETMKKCEQVITRIVIGLYDVWAEDWLNAFPHNQILFFTMDQWHSDCVELLRRIYNFLGLDELSTEQRQKSCNSITRNRRKKSRPPMLKETRRSLNAFFAPHMRRFANLINDTKYVWKF